MFTGKPLTIHIVPKGSILPPHVIHIQSTPTHIKQQPPQVTMPAQLITTPIVKKNVVLELVEEAITFEPITVREDIIQHHHQQPETVTMEEMQEVEAYEEEESEDMMDSSLVKQDTSASSTTTATTTVLLEFSEASTRRLTESGQIRYFCPQCNVRYTKYKYLKTHVKDCGQEFICVCGAKFKQRRTYVAHYKQKHDNNKQETLESENKT